MAGGGGGGNEYEVNINLTALLDVLTNLLFFLMFGFAAQQASMELDSGLVLPTSSAELPPRTALKVLVTKNELKVEKEVVARIENGRIALSGPDDARIEPLYRKLVTLQGTRSAGQADEQSNEYLFVVCDKGTPYSLLKKVLMSGAEAGFPKFRMAVLMQ